MQNPQKNLYKKFLGRIGERKACKYLKKLKYKIIQTNYVTPYGEADIIAIKDNELYFIEVKTRSNEKFGRPAEAVDYKKQERYKQIASYYLLANKLEDINISFSVIEILKNDVNLIKNAF